MAPDPHFGGHRQRLVLLPRPAHDPADEVEGVSEIQDNVSCRELAGVRASARPVR